jgi:GNAT superfamily N-acetyltransferase
MNIQLRRATAADLTTINQLAKAIWHDHYVPMIGASQVTYMLDKFYNEAALMQQMTDGQVFWMIENDGIPEGYVAVTSKGEGEYFLNKFYLSTALQGKGIGAKIFKDVLALYNDLKIIRLQVNKNNYKSINFYFKMSFVIERLFLFDIGEGYFMDDFFMIRK